MMDKKLIRKFVSVVFIFVLILNLVLFGFRKINGLVFWILIIIIAILNYLMKKYL